MDDSVTLSENDLQKITEAIMRMNEAIDTLGVQVGSTNDLIYTTAHGGTSYVIDTSVYEQEAEDNVEFLRKTK